MNVYLAPCKKCGCTEILDTSNYTDVKIHCGNTECDNELEVKDRRSCLTINKIKAAQKWNALNKIE